jgi:hypothetical protein
MKEFFKKFRDKYWIRRERDDFFFTGFILASIAASVITTYWHYFDMTELKPKIRLKGEKTKKELFKEIKDVDFMINLKKSSTFYKFDEYFKPEEKND